MPALTPPVVRGIGIEGSNSSSAHGGADFSPAAFHHDSANGRCLYGKPEIPTNAPPPPLLIAVNETEEANYDVTGLGAGPADTLAGNAPRASGGHAQVFALTAAACLLLHSSGRANKPKRACRERAVGRVHFCLGTID